MVVQDATAGIWVYWSQAAVYSPGDEVDVEGMAASGMYAPVVQAVKVKTLSHASLPKPKFVSFQRLSSGDMDAQYVSIVGRVRWVGIVRTVPASEQVSMKVQLGQRFVMTSLPASTLAAAKRLVDASIRITGTAMCSKNNSGQIIAPIVAASGMTSVTVLHMPPSDLFSRPPVPIRRLMQYRSGTDFEHRVRVEGTVTYYSPSQGFTIEKDGAALSIKTSDSNSIHIGDRVEAVGFPAPRESGPVLEDAVVRKVSAGGPLQPVPVKIDDIRSGNLNYNLVSTEGRLLRRIREPAREVLLLQEGPDVLTAELDGFDENAMGRDAFLNIPEGSAIKVSGISNLEVGGTWNYGMKSAEAVRFKLLLRSPADVQVLRPPSWWTTRHVVYLALALGILAFAFLAQVLRSLVQRWRLQTVVAERERLAHEIHDTLAQSFAGIGFQLQAIRRAVPQELPHVQRQLDLAQVLVRHSHKEARRSFEPLRTETEENVDLLPALENSAKKMVEGGAVTIASASSGVSRATPPHIAKTLLRIGQEAIANAVRHADPTHLMITLLYKWNAVTLSIQDNGVGFVKRGDLLGFGLRGMRTRAAAIYADLEIQSRPGHGTCITVAVRLPFSPNPLAIMKSLRIYLMERLPYVHAEQQPDSHFNRR